MQIITGTRNLYRTVIIDTGAIPEADIGLACAASSSIACGGLNRNTGVVEAEVI